MGARVCNGGSPGSDDGFEWVGVRQIVAYTPTNNMRSRAVMERLGMSHDPADDFEHPSLPLGHPLRRFVLYRISWDRWRAATLGR